MPFENSMYTFDLQGKYLLAALEYSVAQSRNSNKFSSRNMLQISGLKVIFDVRKPIGQRVIDVQVLCQKCKILSYEPLDENKFYRIVAQEFLANGGDGFFVIRDNMKNIEWVFELNAF